MNYEQALDYRNSGFNNCPYCKSKNIEARRFNYDIMGMSVECLDCKKEWQDNYDIVSVGYYDKGKYQEHGVDLESRLAL